MKFLIVIFFLTFLPFFTLAADKVDINTASSAQLDTLIGIGPALAQRIIDARPFFSVDDLLRVKGIGPIVLQKIKSQNLAYVSPETECAQSDCHPRESGDPDPLQKIWIPVSAGMTEIKIYPSNIFFVEIMPSPEGDDEIGEYIKIRNGNNFEVNLSGWKIEDLIGTIKSYSLTEKIPSLGTLNLSRTKTGITLNNSGDSLRLTNPNGDIIDKVDFEKSKNGTAYLKIGSEWKWNEKVEPKKETVKTTENTIQKGAASVIKSKTIDLVSPKPNSPILSIALFTALFLASFFLYLKKKID